MRRGGCGSGTGGSYSKILVDKNRLVLMVFLLLPCSSSPIILFVVLELVQFFSGLIKAVVFGLSFIPHTYRILSHELYTFTSTFVIFVVVIV